MKALLKYSILISILGVFVLYMISIYANQTKVDIGKINNDYLEKTVCVQGKIIKINNYKSSQSLTIEDNTGKINVYATKITKLKENQTIEVIGKISEYKNSLEITADKISEIDNSIENPLF